MFKPPHVSSETRLIIPKYDPLKNIESALKERRLEFKLEYKRRFPEHPLIFFNDRAKQISRKRSLRSDNRISSIDANHSSISKSLSVEETYSVFTFKELKSMVFSKWKTRLDKYKSEIKQH